MSDPVSDPTRGKWIDMLVPAVFIVSWLAVQAFVLPRFGVCPCCSGSCSPTRASAPEDVPSTDPTVSAAENR
jgi:hypothetical protein